jgi:hypothetical protein
MPWVAFHHVKPDKVNRPCRWMGKIGKPRQEVLETLAQEGTQHELACLTQCGSNPVLVFLAEVEDPGKASPGRGRSAQQARDAPGGAIKGWIR